jgi:hypothetical protein
MEPKEKLANEVKRWKLIKSREEVVVAVVTKPFGSRGAELAVREFKPLGVEEGPVGVLG